MHRWLFQAGQQFKLHSLNQLVYLLHSHVHIKHMSNVYIYVYERLIACLLIHCTVLNNLFLSAAFKLDCSVDDSGLITIDCIEIDGEIGSGQLYCIYDNGQREYCMPAVTLSL